MFDRARVVEILAHWALPASAVQDATGRVVAHAAPEATLDAEGRSPLHLAAEFAEKKTLLLLAELYPHCVNLTTSAGDTALHIVAHRKRKDLLEMLKTAGATEVHDRGGIMPAQLISVTFLTRSLANAEKWVSASRPALPFIKAALGGEQAKSEESVVELAAAGKLEALEKLLLQSKSSLNVNWHRPFDRKTALHACCGTGRVCVALLLLHSGALPECLDCDGGSPMHDACASNEPLVSVFLKFGAQPTLANRFGQTPLGLAISRGFLDAAQCLLPHYSMSEELLNATDGEGDSYLHAACRLADPVALVAMLFSRPLLDLNLVSYATHETAVFLALGNSFELFKLFLSDKRTNVNARDRHGTPLIVLVFERPTPHVVLESFLAREGVELNAQDISRGFTALHAASARQDEMAVSMLVSAGADESICSLDDAVAADLRVEKGTSVFKKMFQRSSTKLSRRSSQSSAALADQSETISATVPTAPTADEELTAAVPKDTDLEQLISRVGKMQKGAPPPRPATASLSAAVAAAVAPPSNSSSAVVDVSVNPNAVPVTFATCVSSIDATQTVRDYTPPGNDTLPPAVQRWRTDLAAVRAEQCATNHSEHSAALRQLLPILERMTQSVEQLVAKASLDVAALDAEVRERDAKRIECLACLEMSTLSGKELWALQAREEDILLNCDADQRTDDSDCANVMTLLGTVTSLREGLLKERQKSDSMVRALVAQLQAEVAQHKKWQVESEKLTRINRLLDMRQFLQSVRREKANQESWLEQSLKQEGALRSVVKLQDEARQCQESLSEATRILQRHQLQLEEACRFRDLLQTEGSAASPQELESAAERVATARDRFMSLKTGHSQLVERANALGRSGFPEVWRNISFHIRGGALLSIESFENLRPLRPPHIFVGEKDGRSFVLKARKVGQDKKARRAFDTELFILKRLRHPLVVQLEATFQQGDTFYLVLPFYPEGTFRDWLQRQGGPTSLDRPVAKNMFRGVLQALTFLHSNQICHGDVKLENILIDKEKPVLADFDTSEDGSFFDVTQTSAMAPGTLLYMAPELFETGSRVTTMSDMFSFGVCIFLAHFTAEVYLPPKASHVQLPNDRDVNLRNLLEMLLSRDPLARPSADECLAHPWFRAVSTERGEDAASTQLELFREMLRLTKNGIRGFPVRAKLAPDRVVQDGLTLFSSLENQTRPLRVQFEGEKGSDAGGVTTSLYRRFFGEILADTSLFERRSGGSFLPAPAALAESMRAFGIAVSRCLFDERVVDLRCASAMFKFLFSAPCDFGDLESFDEPQAHQLKGLLRCPGVETFGLTFEFVDATDETLVTDANKEHFVRRKIEYELVLSRKRALEAVKEGFWSLLALHKPLKLLGWRECVVLLSGSTFLSPAMICSALVFDGFAVESQVPAFLVAVLEELSLDMLRLFLFFVTEQPTIPFGGLRNPRNHAPVDKITVKASRSPLDALPTSSVCFYCLHLPLYQTKDVLRAKLEVAIRETGTSLDLR